MQMFNFIRWSQPICYCRSTNLYSNQQFIKISISLSLFFTFSVKKWKWPSQFSIRKPPPTVFPIHMVSVWLAYSPDVLPAQPWPIPQAQDKKERRLRLCLQLAQWDLILQFLLLSLRKRNLIFIFYFGLSELKECMLTGADGHARVWIRAAWK